MKQRAIVFFLWKEGSSASAFDIVLILKKVFGEMAVKLQFTQMASKMDSKRLAGKVG